MTECVEHSGIIKKTQGNILQVQIDSISSCQQCHSKNMCSMGKSESKIIEVLKTNDYDYSVGENVILTMESGLGLKAVLWGYLIPFLCVLSVLIVVYLITNNEIFSGLSAILSLIPYYIVLFFFKNQLKKHFTFRIKS